ncbi:MAG: hypothetical protein AAGA42_15155 [Actinomycetota bacterium]
MVAASLADAGGSEPQRVQRLNESPPDADAHLVRALLRQVGLIIAVAVIAAGCWSAGVVDESGNVVVDDQPVPTTGVETPVAGELDLNDFTAEELADLMFAYGFTEAELAQVCTGFAIVPDVMLTALRAEMDGEVSDALADETTEHMKLRLEADCVGLGGDWAFHADQLATFVIDRGEMDDSCADYAEAPEAALAEMNSEMRLYLDDGTIPLEGVDEVMAVLTERYSARCDAVNASRSNPARIEDHIDRTWRDVGVALADEYFVPGVSAPGELAALCDDAVVRPEAAKERVRAQLSTPADPLPERFLEVAASAYLERTQLNCAAM